MRTYEITLRCESFYTFDVKAHDEEEARQLATNRAESGDWGRENFGRVDIFDVEETK